MLTDVGIGPFLMAAGALLVLLVIIVVQADIGPRYKARPLLNASERKLMAALTAIVPSLPGTPLSIFPQVSYGEFLSSSQKGFLRINAKRADFVLADHEFNVVAVIEYQGRGHYGSSRRDRASAEKRDSVKRRALASAGIPMIEVPARFSNDSLHGQLAAALISAASQER